MIWAEKLKVRHLEWLTSVKSVPVKIRHCSTAPTNRPQQLPPAPTQLWGQSMTSWLMKQLEEKTMGYWWQGRVGNRYLWKGIYLEQQMLYKPYSFSLLGKFGKISSSHCCFEELNLFWGYVWVLSSALKASVEGCFDTWYNKKGASWPGVAALWKSKSTWGLCGHPSL